MESSTSDQEAAMNDHLILAQQGRFAPMPTLLVPALPQ
jgi:hypothetical protein